MKEFRESRVRKESIASLTSSSSLSAATPARESSKRWSRVGGVESLVFRNGFVFLGGVGRKEIPEDPWPLPSDDPPRKSSIAAACLAESGRGLSRRVLVVLTLRRPNKGNGAVLPLMVRAEDADAESTTTSNADRHLRAASRILLPLQLPLVVLAIIVTVVFIGRFCGSSFSVVGGIIV
mmetsp:Transcript_46925/g.97404  ORF Transcript_46925/g.97404 Transcript_46925/m.97404 type:complete len:179 (-) Transcript_46925:182-718(-)